MVPGNSQAVQWLGLGALTAGARVQYLIGELRSCKLRSVAKKNTNKQTNKKRMVPERALRLGS